MTRNLTACLTLLSAGALFAASNALTPDANLVPPSLRKQAESEQAWLQSRLDVQLPDLLRKHGVAMWIVACREYAEDPAFFSLVSPTVFAARRTTVYVFNDKGTAEGVEKLALGGDSNGGLYTVYRDPAAPAHEIYGDSQWLTLRQLSTRANPRTSPSTFPRPTLFPMA